MDDGRRLRFDAGSINAGTSGTRYLQHLTTNGQTLELLTGKFER